MNTHRTDHEALPTHCRECGRRLVRNHSWADEIGYCHDCENIRQNEAYGENHHE